MEALPLELMHSIFLELSVSDWRSLRLTSKHLRDRSAPFLFHTLDIYPYAECFRWVADHPTIRPHVRCVRYHSKALGQYDTREQWLEMGVRHGLGYLDEARYGRFLARYSAADLDRHYRLYQDYLASQTHVRANEFDYLRNLFKSLPGLRRARLVAPDDNPPWPESPDPDTILHPITRDALLWPTPGALTGASSANQLLWILMAAAEARAELDEVSFENMDWVLFDRSSPCDPRVLEALSSVKHLSVGMEMAVEEDTDRARIRRLASLVATAKSLKTLSLAFDGYSFQSSVHQALLPHLMEYRPFWPSLRRIELRGIDTHLNELLIFLTHHSTTLRELKLCYIQLAPPGPVSGDPPDQKPPPCGLSLVEALRTALHLERMEFGGYLTNGRDEAWYVEDNLPCCKAGRFHNDCIKGRVEGYVVNGGDDECWARIRDDLRFDGEGGGGGDGSWYFGFDMLPYI